MNTPLLHVQHLAFAWPRTGTLVLKNINLDISPEESVGISGKNGSGKTTLFSCVSGLLPLSGGQIFFKNKAVTSESDFQKLRLEVGYCLQSAEDQIIFPTVMEDVSFGPRNQGLSQQQALQRAEETLQLVGIGEFGKRLTSELSGGELRLAALAGILAMKPQLILLDEPFTGLDIQACKHLQTVLCKLSCAKIIVAHDEQLLNALCSRQLVLADGLLHEAAPSSS